MGSRTAVNPPINFLKELRRALKPYCRIKIRVPPEEEVERALRDAPTKGGDLLATVTLTPTQGKSRVYRCPYPLPNGALLLNGTLRALELRFLEGQRLSGSVSPEVRPPEINRLVGLLRKGVAWRIEAYLNSDLNDPRRFPHLDRTNPLSEVCALREVFHSGEYLRRKIRALRQEDFYRFCPFDTSDKDPGRSVSLAIGARVEGGTIIKSGRFFLGYAAGLVPFLQHTRPTRVQVAAKELQQALPLVSAQVPIVATGLEREVAELSGRLRTAKGDGTVIDVAYSDDAGGAITVKEARKTNRVYPLSGCIHAHSGTGFGGASYWETPRVRKGQRARAGDLIAEGCGLRDGQLALGVNLLVAYMPWFGYNFEDAVVISDRLRRKDLLTSLHVYEECLSPLVGGGLEEWKGQTVERGTPLEERLAFTRRFRGQVIHVIDRKEEGRQALWILGQRKVEVGDKLSGRHGNKGVVSLVVPEEEMPYFTVRTTDGRQIRRRVDILLNPTSVVSRVSLGQVLEAHYGWVLNELRCRPDLRDLARDKLPTLENVGEPFGRVDLEELRTLLEATGLDGRGRAVLYRDVKGRKDQLGKYVVGYQYVVKLAHLSRDNMMALGRARAFDPVTGHPKEGRRIGEEGVRALLAHGTPALLQELLTAASDDERARKQLRFDGEFRASFPRTLKALRYYLRGLGLDLVFLKDAKGQNVFTKQELESKAFSVDQVKGICLKVADPDEISDWEYMRPLKLHKPIPHPLFEEKRPSCKPGGLVPIKGQYEVVDRDGNEVRTEPTRTFRLNQKFPRLRRGYRWRRTVGWRSTSTTKLTYIPQIPREYRWKSVDGQEPDLDRLYREVRSARKVKHIYSAVKRLFITGKRIRGKRGKLKSILEHLSGKEGLLRGLLRKEHQYSGMAVIVPDPGLTLNEIGLPLDLALEILKPLRFDLGLGPFWWKHVEGGRQVYDPSLICRELDRRLKAKDVLFLALRHPIQHKYNILAFRPRLRDDYCIGLPPLLCRGFGADFDGDRMMTILPLTREARREAQDLLPTNNLFSSATGKPGLTWTQDFRLGQPLARELDDWLPQILGRNQDRENVESRLLQKQKRILGEATRSGVTFSILEVAELADALKNGPASDQNIKATLERLQVGNSVARVVHTAARGTIQQVREMAAQVGTVQWRDAKGETQKHSISSNFLNGLSKKEYQRYAFFVRHLQIEHARWAREVHDAVRRLTENAFELTITEVDCGRSNGSPLDCSAKGGLCQKCYGQEHPQKTYPAIGSHVGVLAAQSLGEALAQEVLKVHHRSPEEGVRPPAFKGLSFSPGGDPEGQLQKIKSWLKDSRLDVDARHIEVLLRAARQARIRGSAEARTNAEIGRGWLAAAVSRSPQKILVQAATSKAVDGLARTKSRIVIGQRYDGKPPTRQRLARSSEDLTPVIHLLFSNGKLEGMSIPSLARTRPSSRKEFRAFVHAIHNLAKGLADNYRGKYLVEAGGKIQPVLTDQDLPHALWPRKRSLLNRYGVVLPSGRVHALKEFFIEGEVRRKAGRPRTTDPALVREYVSMCASLKNGHFPRIRAFLTEKSGKKPLEQTVNTFYKRVMSELKRMGSRQSVVK